MTSSAGNSPKLTRAEQSVFKTLESQDRVNRDNGKRQFRIGDTKLAEKTGYRRTTLKTARNGLHSKGLLDWKRTGRTNFYWLPQSTHPIRAADRQPDDGQGATISSSEIDHRNKAGLKNHLRGGGVGKGGVHTVPGTIDQSTKVYSTKQVQQQDSEADDVVLDFLVQTDSKTQFDSNAFVAAHGMARLCSELKKLQGMRNLIIYADMTTGEITC